MEGAGKGGVRPFNCCNFKNKELMFKVPTVVLDTIIFSYGQPKDSAPFIKSNEALSRCVGINFKVGGPIAVMDILLVTDPYLRLP